MGPIRGSIATVGPVSPASSKTLGVDRVQVKISARHGHLSETAQKGIEEKASKLLHYFERLTMIEVVIDLADDLHKSVEILVSAEHKHDFVATESAPELHAAVDMAIHKIERQIAKYKEKIQDHRRDQHVGEVTPPASRR
jgi:putative sigma-54 modulation protein